LAVLHPGARWPTKLWPAAHWARLADWLAREHGFQVAITGSHGDRGLVGEIIGQAEIPPLNLAGRTTLAELASVLKTAR
jgi:heptosyltransferase I